jgi:hypothetical protein
MDTKFRSELEARWAVFFTVLGISWEYDDLSNPGPDYKPTFWLPQVNMWADVMPERFASWQKKGIKELTKKTGYLVLRLEGLPQDKPYKALEPESSGKFVDYGYCLTMYHNYPIDEHRFYCNPGSYDDSHWEDTADAAFQAIRFVFAKEI